jgi:multidrug efflux pump subunit AcrA (membrane-fusion protein)
MINEQGSVPHNNRVLSSLPRIAAGLILALTLCGRQSAPQWRTAPVEKGDLNVEVTASGTVNPHARFQLTGDKRTAGGPARYHLSQRCGP